MKKYQTIRVIAVFLIVLPVAFSACIKDQCKRSHTYTWYEPIYRTKDEVRANIKSNAPVDLKNTGKFYVYGNYIFLNEVDKGIHVIDNTDPSHPRNIAFITIPGNIDLAVKGNILYADLYTDLVAMDISNPSNITVKKIVDYVFPERQYANGFYTDNSKVVVDWKRVDSTIIESCGNQNGIVPIRTGVFFTATGSPANQSMAAAPAGTGGSMARFTIVNNFMYAVDHHELRAISISNPSDPVLSGTINAGWDIETIYPFKDKLFLGSMGGMFIFDISNPATPVSQGNFIHARACDPVIADDNYAYVTLRAGTVCGASDNELQVINVQNLQTPTLVKKYPMTGPYGLAKDNNLLFVCDGTDGLKIYNASNVQNLQLVKTFSGISTFDVIAYNNRAILVAGDGLYQYDYSNVNDIRLLSRITVNK
ncbi:MAG: hypothetical protein Q8941_22050 [Bacteroidota bacterium]|nr:hypothetical protein [Bacteroidota bacterium]